MSKSVIGYKELIWIYSDLERRVKSIRKFSYRFRFAGPTFKSLGKVSLPLATQPVKPLIYTIMDAVPAQTYIYINIYVLPLLGSEVLDCKLLMADKVASRLYKRSVCHTKNDIYFYNNEWNVPLFPSFSNHVYVEIDCSTSVTFTRSQLPKSLKKLFRSLQKNHSTSFRK